MIYKPTIAQLIEAVRHDLQFKVAPFVTDPTARIALDMSILVLATALVRSEHELAWMLAEADAVQELSRRLSERHPQAEVPAGALAEYEHHKGTRGGIDEVNADYERASELLSLATEAAYAAGDADAIRELMVLFRARRDHQNTASGGYVAVGRS